MARKLMVKREGREVAAFELDDARRVVLGRSAEVEFSVSGEDFLSRRHVTLKDATDGVQVDRLPHTTNPIVFQGSEKDSFLLRAGEFFVIGTTTFHLVGHEGEGVALEGPGLEARPNVTHTMSADELQERSPAGDRMRLLDLMELPVVLRTKSRAEFYVYACGTIRNATGADWVQAVWMGDDSPIVLAEDARVDHGGVTAHSRRLMQSAIDDAPRPVTYCWGGTESGDGASLDVTAHEGVGWAICCAMPVPGEEPVLFYVAGQGTGGSGMSAVTACDMSLRNTARLVGLVADMIGRAISMEKLEGWKSRLGQFFSEKVVTEILESDDEDALAPRITEATVMFFDIRGFSAKTEASFSLREEENLQRILDFTKARRVVLNAVSQCVIDHQGVIISYAGDGLLACWNVPKPLENHASYACLAAIEMTECITKLPGDWRCGIGVACGQVVAGSLGSDQKEQYDILGAVANQSSRIEGITKVVGVQLLVTDAVANVLDAERFIARRVARFRPAGMNDEVNLFTVDRTPADADTSKALQERYAAYTMGLEAFEAGKWEDAFKALTPIATEDSAAKYLLSMAIKGEAPANWRGVVELTSK